MWQSKKVILTCTLAALLATYLTSCQQPQPQVENFNDGLNLEDAQKALELQHDLLLDSTATFAPQQPQFPSVVAHQVIADLRGGRQSTLFLELQFIPGGATIKSKVECDANRLALALLILENKDVLYDENTQTLMYSTQTYSFINPIASN